jgi:hypothetical protein
MRSTAVWLSLSVLLLVSSVGSAQNDLEQSAAKASDGKILAPGALWELPQCTPPGIFADQPCLPPPAQNTFTNFVEQIFNDQISAGCGVDGGGHLLYCPNSPVTRKQMAVFLEQAMRGTAVWTPGIPKGGIIMWSGATAMMPSGWGFCDGNYYDPDDPSAGQVGQPSPDATHTVQTPNLTDRFILSVATAAETPGGTGGTHSYVLTEATLPAHTHTATTGVESADHSHSGSTSYGGLHYHSYTAPGWDTRNYNSGWGGYSTTYTTNTSQDGYHSHSFSTTGASASHTHSLTTNSTGGGAAIDNRPAYFTLAFIMRL